MRQLTANAEKEKDASLREDGALAAQQVPESDKGMLEAQPRAPSSAPPSSSS